MIDGRDVDFEKEEDCRTNKTKRNNTTRVGVIIIVIHVSIFIFDLFIIFIFFDLFENF